MHGTFPPPPLFESSPFFNVHFSELAVKSLNICGRLRRAAFQQKVNSPIDVGVATATTLAIKLMAPLIM